MFSMPLCYYFLRLLSHFSFHTYLTLKVVPEAFADKFSLHMDSSSQPQVLELLNVIASPCP